MKYLQYRSKAKGTIVEAVQWHAGNCDEVVALVGHTASFPLLDIHLSEHEELSLRHGDWLVKYPKADYIGSQYQVFSDREFKDKFDENLMDLDKLEKLWSVCEKFIKKHSINCAETIHQCDGPQIDATNFIEEVCDVVGYDKSEED
jgi:hypothetical protein